MSVYSFEVRTIRGEARSLNDYAGNVLLIVNTASKCGFTPQYKGLQSLYETYQMDGLVVLGFPCNQFMSQEPGTEEEIQQFCEVNYHVTFPMFAKIDVNGADAHPLYRYLVKEAPGMLTDSIKWNFTKFLVDRKGNVVKRYAPTTKPEDLEEDIKRLLAK
ncbi:glutathione peroxidase [Brevibacillus ginsengisoli]|uniref:glutathione peroxidase n=1 Tax=Brevibacillus ginsengisoli TaxID=363854 RepID=UPI003CED8E65